MTDKTPPNVPTRERLLLAAQDILAESGLEALNSNAIVERAGVTPPSFYHYFRNKHAVLRELGARMMLAQSEALRADTGLRITTQADLHAASLRMLRESFKVTRAFRGGYALLVSLRAIPELRDVRLESHADMSVLVAEYLKGQGLSDDFDELVVRSRLALELAYAAIEMLFETDFANQDAVLSYTADGLVKVYGLF
ncbi:MAG: TetR/AcrR family transcriptional regulator [Oceanicaulis sp.]|nr:TetR/AcrR family transcriptional regulator [Oceanicaulis sp.]